MRRHAVLLAFTALLTGPAQAQPPMSPRAEDHLEAGGSILGDTSFGDPKYEMQLRDLLREMFASDVAVRMVAIPAFTPEYAVGLRKRGIVNGSPYRIFALTLEEQFETFKAVMINKNGKLLAPALPENPKVTRCEAYIGEALGNRIVEVWHKMLLGTRYSTRNTNGTDGATYYFSMLVPRVALYGGMVWLPARNSATGNLVAIAETMRAICEKKNGANEAELEKFTTELEHRLQ